MGNYHLCQSDVTVEAGALTAFNDFYEKIPTLEKELGQKIIIHEDKKTGVNFVECHVSSATLE